jgi:hypothetical protein
VLIREIRVKHFRFYFRMLHSAVGLVLTLPCLAKRLRLGQLRSAEKFLFAVARVSH